MKGGGKTIEAIKFLLKYIDKLQIELYQCDKSANIYRKFFENKNDNAFDPSFTQTEALRTFLKAKEVVSHHSKHKFSRFKKWILNRDVSEKKREHRLLFKELLTITNKLLKKLKTEDLDFLLENNDDFIISNVKRTLQLNTYNPRDIVNKYCYKYNDLEEDDEDEEEEEEKDEEQIQEKSIAMGKRTTRKHKRRRTKHRRTRK
jgi:hypothetical protein